MIENFPPSIPLGRWIADAIDWVSIHLRVVLDAIKRSGTAVNDGLVDVLLFLPPLAMILVFAALAWLVRSWKLAIGTTVTFLLIVSMDLWTEAMQTLALVMLATTTAVVIAVPLGIWAARNDRVSAVVRPVLDLMQTMPAMVYLIPAIMFFSLGAVPGMFATIIFSLPPGVRLTELGIRSVDKETVEAGESFGASDGEILRGIQLPLAIPTIMAGINQVIMLALSMVVIAGMVGAKGLGDEVVRALSMVRMADGVEAGLAIVFLAIFLDRFTGALGSPAENTSSLLAKWKFAREEKARKAQELAATAV
ncbi:MAG: proline/glycine betaine ABC transporter permease [Tessaracoccus sp.]